MRHDQPTAIAGTGTTDELQVELGEATALTLGGDRSGSEDKRYVYSFVDPVLEPAPGSVTPI